MQTVLSPPSTEDVNTSRPAAQLSTTPAGPDTAQQAAVNSSVGASCRMRPFRMMTVCSMRSATSAIRWVETTMVQGCSAYFCTSSL